MAIVGDIASRDKIGMIGKLFESGPMYALYEVMSLLTRAQALLDESDETLIAAQLSSVLDLIEARIGSSGDRPN